MKKLSKILVVLLSITILFGCNKKTEITDEEVEEFAYNFVKSYILTKKTYDYKEMYEKYLDPDNEMFNKEMYIRQKSLEIYLQKNPNKDVLMPDNIYDGKINKINDEYTYDANVENLSNKQDPHKIRLVMKIEKDSLKVINYYGFDNESLFLGKYSEGGDAVRGPEYYGNPTSATGEDLKKLQRAQLIDILEKETGQEVHEFPEYLEK